MSTDEIGDEGSLPGGVCASVVTELRRARRAAGTAVVRRFRRWKRRRAIRRAAAELRGLGDAALRDIGIHGSGAVSRAAEAYDQDERTERNLRA